MKLFKIKNDQRNFVKEVFSFVGATNAVVQDGFTGTWILEAGDKDFIFTAAVGDEWWEIHRDNLVPA